MKKLLAIAATGFAGLALAAPAAAKEMTLLQVCGTNGCNAIEFGRLSGEGGLGSATRPSLQSYYVLTVGAGDGKRIFERMKLYFVPDPGVFTATESGAEGWGALPARAVAAIKAAAKGLKPFRKPELAEVYVGDHRSVDPAPYTAVLGPLEKAYVPSKAESPISLSLDWKRPNPWSNDGAMIFYLAKAKVLMRSDGYFHLPESLAPRIDRERLGLAPLAPGNGFPWSTVAGSLAGALLLAAALVAFARRRRPRAAERTVPA